jgi:predicted enzyme related to lactoylglutathione lyase
MDGKITHFALLVKNQADALKFYTEKVGFEKKADFTSPEGYRWVTVGPEGQELELVLTQAGTTEGASSAFVTMRVDDCRMASRELESHGVQFKQEPTENLWSVSAIFTDPDGNLFQMNQFPQRAPSGRGDVAGPEK